jgi:hypothetical protein
MEPSGRRPLRSRGSQSEREATGVGDRAAVRNVGRCHGSSGVRGSRLIGALLTLGLPRPPVLLSKVAFFVLGRVGQHGRSGSSTCQEYFVWATVHPALHRRICLTSHRNRRGSPRSSHLHVHIVPEGEGRPGSPDREGRGRLSQYLPTKPISLALVPRNAGDVHVYRHGRWSVAIGAAGGLEALQFVRCFVEATLYSGLASGELRGYALLHVEGHFLG